MGSDWLLQRTTRTILIYGAPLSSIEEKNTSSTSKCEGGSDVTTSIRCQHMAPKAAVPFITPEEGQSL